MSEFGPRMVCTACSAIIVVDVVGKHDVLQHHKRRSAGIPC
jgi:hypothetical protein